MEVKMGDQRLETMTQEDKLELARAVTRLREFVGKSQKDVAEAAGIPRSTYTNMERYGMGSPETFTKALTALNTDLDRVREWYAGAQLLTSKATGTAG
jgi:transcriptional regulator with XRE-family HTH domain